VCILDVTLLPTYCQNGRFKTGT